jgi:hypothetical protein
LDRSLPESEDLNSASNGQDSDPSSGKSSATTTPRASSKSTGPTLPGFETCESATGRATMPTPHGMCVPNPRRAGPTGNELGYAATHDSRPLTSSAAAFLARMSVWRGGVLALRALARGCGRSLPDSLAKLAPDGSWPRTSQGYCQLTMEGDSERYSGTWPRSGTMRGGIVYPLRPLAPLTDVIACLSLPMLRTPGATDGDHGGPNARDSRGGLHLSAQAHVWPTPRAGQEAEGRGDLLGAVKGWPAAKHHGRQTWPTPNRMDGERGPDARDRPGSGGPNLSSAVGGGQLNPEWVTWLMGFPPGWADVGEPNPTCPE